MIRRLRYWLLAVRLSAKMLENREERIRKLASEKSLLLEMVAERDMRILALNERVKEEAAQRKRYKSELDMDAVTKRNYRRLIRDLNAQVDKLSIPHALGPQDLESQA